MIFGAKIHDQQVHGKIPQVQNPGFWTNKIGDWPWSCVAIFYLLMFFFQQIQGHPILLIPSYQFYWIFKKFTAFWWEGGQSWCLPQKIGRWSTEIGILKPWGVDKHQEYGASIDKWCSVNHGSWGTKQTGDDKPHFLFADQSHERYGYFLP